MQLRHAPWTFSKDMEQLHAAWICIWLAVRTCSVDMSMRCRHTASAWCEFVARTCTRDMQRGEAAFTCSLNMQQGHATKRCSMEKQQSHAARTCTKGMQQGHATKTCSMEKQQSHAAWTCSKGMQQGHATKRCSMDMQYGHVVWTWDRQSAKKSGAPTFACEEQICSLSKASKEMYT